MADVGWATIRRFESSNLGCHRPAKQMRAPGVKNALEAAGIVFLGDPGRSPGVQLVSKAQSTKSTQTREWLRQEAARIN